jgi:pyruvate/2-oxoglutarate dehydrogenase complex dihydrolipoamide dehydrogenase (E3) component
MMPDWPGLDREKVVYAADVLLGKAIAGLKVLIVGGGAIGCETAHFLAEYGKAITIVEMLDAVGTDLGFIPRPLMLEKLRRWGVETKTSAKVLELTTDGCVAEINGERTEISGFDTIVLALGYAPVSALYEQVRRRVTETYLVGDARTPRKVMESMTDAFETALRI